MNQYKHFSHHHSLSYHQVPQGHATRCSGCKTQVISGSMFVCWHCKFHLHEQCYQASRSINHPSHPPHPLTLVPYPTHPSGSFICNSCNLVGTGFSFTCASCDFDLHVHCANSIPKTTPFQPYPNNPHTYLPIPNATQPNNFHAQIGFPSNMGSIPNHMTNINEGHPPNLQQIRHDSHSKHPLTLLSPPPYNNGTFTCDACGKEGNDCTYNCHACSFDLHVKCASLPKSMKRDDHEHPLALYYSVAGMFPYTQESVIFSCDVCSCTVPKNFWVYYCKECDFGTHVNCVTEKRRPKSALEQCVADIEAVSEYETQLAIAVMEAKFRRQAIDAILGNT